MISLIVTIALVGLLVWAITTLVPMPEPFRRAITVVAIGCLALYVLAFFGLLPAGVAGHARFH